MSNQNSIIEAHKKRFIISSGSIDTSKVSTFDDYPFDDESPFANGLSLDLVADMLGNDIESKLTKENPLFEIQRVFNEHLKLLNRTVNKKYGKTVLNFGSFEILPNEDARFGSLGNLQNVEEDSIEIHTKQAFRFWEGNNNIEGNGRRWPGVRYGMVLIQEILQIAQNNNPYATVALLKFENDSKELCEYLDLVINNIKKQIQELNDSSGLRITVLKSNETVFINIPILRGYGFSLLEMLAKYDLFVRLVKTLELKGLVANKEANKLLHDTYRKIINFMMNLYTTNKEINIIKNITVSDLVSNKEMQQQVKLAIQNESLEKLPIGIITKQVSPKLLFIKDDKSQEQLEKIASTLLKNGICKDN